MNEITTEPQMTVSAFAMAHGHDRRTITRRLLAAGIQPIQTHGKANYYRVADLQKVMQGDDGGLSAMDRDDQFLVAALGFLGQRLEDCMFSALKPLKVSDAKTELVTLRMWSALVQVVANATHGPGNGSEVPIIVPEPILALAAKRKINLTDVDALID